MIRIKIKAHCIMNSVINFIEDNILFVLLCAVLFYVVFSSQYYSEHFETSNKKTLTLYYAPWCPHCKPVKPVFDELSKIYAGNKHINIETVNGDEEPNKLKEQNVKGYPTIKLVIGEKSVEYKGERTAEKLQEFIQSY
jgi:protein disulfide-isomerase-like protein